MLTRQARAETFNVMEGTNEGGLQHSSPLLKGPENDPEMEVTSQPYAQLGALEGYYSARVGRTWNSADWATSLARDGQGNSEELAHGRSLDGRGFVAPRMTRWGMRATFDFLHREAY